MKKLIALTSALFLAFSLAACGDSGNAQNSSIPTPPPSPATSAVIQTAAIPNTEDVNPIRAESVENISVDIMATNAYVMNVGSDSTLYRKNSDERIAPASTTKMLTALTVLDYCSLDDTVTVGSEIDLIAFDSSAAGLNRGDILTVKQLLVALLLPSGNDAAYTIAVNTGKKIAGDDSLGVQPSIDVFVNAMNQKAKEVGANFSNFATPDGYDTDGQYTTAFDLAQIAKACLNIDVLSEIVGSYKISDTWISGQKITYFNGNKLLNPNSQYYYANAVGLKTGTTGDAGSCLVSAAAINGQMYICVVMGSSAESRYADSLTIFNEIDPTLSLPTKDIVPSDTPGRLIRH